MKNGPAYSHEEKIAIIREHEEGHKTLKQVCEKYGISKAAMNGCKWEVDLNAQHFPNAYKFQPASTHIYIEFSNGNFKLMDVKRTVCWRSEKHYRAELTETAKAAIIANPTTC